MRSLAGTVLVAAAALSLLACASEPAGELPPALEGGTGTLTIENATGQVVFRVRFAPAGSEDWGPDRLEPSEVIRPGARRSWPVTGGRYQLQARLDGGETVGAGEEHTVPPGGEAVICLGQDSRGQGALTVVNGTPFAIARVYFSPTNQASWGENRLDPQELIFARKHRTWRVPPGHYNVRIEYQDGVGVSSRAATEVTVGGAGVYEVKPGE